MQALGLGLQKSGQLNKKPWAPRASFPINSHQALLESSAASEVRPPRSPRRSDNDIWPRCRCGCVWPRGPSGAAFVALGSFDLGHKGPQSCSPLLSAGGSARPAREVAGWGWGAARREAGAGREGGGPREGVIHNIYFNNSFKSF